ncbi:retrovirus-related pol polyprotein from transposon TNT 1-94 [Tanacetum coccineum]
MTKNRSQLINLVSKFLGTVRFENDHIAKIMGYEDYQMSNVTISRVYYVEGLGHNLFSMGQFCDSDLEDEVPEFMIKFIKMIQVSLNATVHNIRTDNGTEFVNQTLKLTMKKSKSHIKHPKHHNKTPYELLHDRKPDLSYLHVFGPLCYPTNDGEDLVIAPEPVVSTRTPSSTTIDQDAHSTSTLQTTPETPSLVIPLGVEEADHDIKVVIPNHVHAINQPPIYINKWSKDHPIDNVISDLSRTVSTRHQLQDEALLCYFDAFLSSIEPKSYKDALIESCWIEAMQEELKWKLDKLGGVLKNKARLVARGYRQEEGIDLEESFALVPNGFVDPENLNHVYKLKKALYGLKQAPRAWYDLLSSFLLSHKFTKGTVDPTLFVRHKGKDILLSQRLFLNQSKYALELLKKYGMETCELGDTPMVEKSKLDEDPQGKVVDPTCYHVMIGTLIYLTSSRPDLVFAVCMCARYQTKPTEKHLHAVKRIFRYLRGSINMGLWYPKDSCIALTAFADADHAGCQDSRKSTFGSMKVLGERLCHCSLLQKRPTILIEAYRHQTSLHKKQVENKVVELYFVRTEYQLADIFTKPLAQERLEFLIIKLGMQSMSPDTLKNWQTKRKSNGGTLFTYPNHESTKRENEKKKKSTRGTARDEKWVPSAEKVKISSTNLRLEATVPQKEETFQVVIDIIKNSTCFKAFTISVDYPRNLYEQF